MNIQGDFYKENDNTYLNISFTNPPVFNQFEGITEQILEYNVTKTESIVEDASKYYCCVVSFDFPLTSIPITIFPVERNQNPTDPNYPNISTLVVGIENGITTSYKNLIYVSQNLTPPPVQTDKFKQVITPYYYVYSYTQMIDMINTALQSAYTTAGLTATAPYFVYTSTTGLISLIVGAEFNSSTKSVIINYDLLKYLNAFDITGIGNGYYKFNINGVVNESYAYYPNGSNTPTPLTTPPAAPIAPYFYKLTQEYQYVTSWSPIRTILIVSNTLPIKHEVTPANSIIQNNDGVYTSLPVLSRYTPLIEGVGESRSTAYFTSDGYSGVRLIDMTTSQAIYRVDVKVLWQDYQNNIYPLYIPTWTQANIKLGFLRKDLYKHLI